MLHPSQLVHIEINPNASDAKCRRKVRLRSSERPCCGITEQSDQLAPLP
jgi:hypothetical protein